MLAYIGDVMVMCKQVGTIGYIMLAYNFIDKYAMRHSVFDRAATSIWSCTTTHLISDYIHLYSSINEYINPRAIV